MEKKLSESGSCWISLGAVLAGIAVITGAFAAHGLDSFCAKKYADEPAVTVAGWEHPMAYKRLNDFQVGARYQMYHALGMIALGLLMNHRRSKLLTAAGTCFALGIVLFSGSLYALVLTGIKILGAITPIGGVLMIIGWGLFAWGACSAKPGISQPENE
ncbi:MAG: DUF423 domain-containing protein [Planctomycetaceae bacterium]